MAEKRFTYKRRIEFDDTEITDHKTGEKFYGSYIATRKLNKLSEENEQLKQELLSKNDVIQQLQNNLKTDDRDELLKYRRKFSDACIELSDLNRDIRCLNRENEELKREVEVLRHWNKCLAEKNNEI